MFLAYAVTGRLDFVASIGVGDVILKMIFYYMHEKAWNSSSARFPKSFKDDPML
jgi:uncharacterized membrane protein